MAVKTPLDVVRMIGATGGSRFYAASRLGGKDRFNNFVSISASCLIIVLSVVSLIAKFGGYQTALVTIANIALSVAVLAFSAYQLAGNFAVNAELMHRSGLEINELCAFRLRKFWITYRRIITVCH